MKFEVDTGSPVSVINVEVKNKYFSNLEITKTDLKLNTYGDASLNVLGYIQVEVQKETHLYKLPLYILDVNGHPLLGRQWIRTIQLKWSD